MEIFDFSVLKNTINENYKFNKTLFKNKKNNVYVENIAYPKLFLNFDIISTNISEFKFIKKFLEENIDKQLIVPIYSSLFKNDLLINSNTITNSNINNFTFKKDDYLLYSQNGFTDFQMKLITNLNNNTLTLDSNVVIEANSTICCGKILSLDNNISIDDVSNNYKRFNISFEEL